MTDPDGAKWEWYVKTGDSDQLTNQIVGEDETAMCCAPAAAEPVTLGRSTAASRIRLLLNDAPWRSRGLPRAPPPRE